VAVIIEHKVREGEEEEERVFVFPWHSELYHPTAILLMLLPKKVGEERVLRTKDQ
jgi:hypothetical protein